MPRSLKEPVGLNPSHFRKILNFTPTFFIALIKAIIIGDIINLLTYKMRPYEVEKGSVDQAVEVCKNIVSQAFSKHASLIKAMWKCRSILEKVKLNRLQPKAKVMVMGEFWAAMTEGDGNYNLHKFLEAEGAECIPQPILNRLMLSLWEAEQALKNREQLEVENSKNKFLVLIHAIQRDALTNKFIHIDFYQSSLDQEIEAKIPLILTGTAFAEKELGGTLIKHIQEIEVKALPENLPHQIEVEIDCLKTFDDNILIKDLKTAKQVKILKREDEIVVSVSPPEKVEEELEKPVEEKVEEVEKIEKDKKSKEAKIDK